MSDKAPKTLPDQNQESIKELEHSIFTLCENFKEKTGLEVREINFAPSRSQIHVSLIRRF
jgi:hypothetical protein